VPFFRTRNCTLPRIHFQTQAPFNEASDAFHHPLPSTFTAHVDVGIIGVPDKAMAALVKLSIEFVEHNIA
jgi:hypothetical protein